MTITQTICPTKPIVLRLEGKIKHIKRRRDLGLVHINLADDRNGEYWVRVHDQHRPDFALQVGLRICVEFGYLMTTRPGGGSDMYIDARLVRHCGGDDDA